MKKFCTLTTLLQQTRAVLGAMAFVVTLSHAIPAVAEVPAELNKVVSELQDRRPGVEILRARTITRGERRIHVIKFLTSNGKVRFLRVDANTGKRS